MLEHRVRELTLVRCARGEARLGRRESTPVGASRRTAAASGRGSCLRRPGGEPARTRRMPHSSSPGSTRSRRGATRTCEWRWISVPVRRAAEAVLHWLRRRERRQLDASYYDLLASEARLASFVAIAKDDVPVEHWFRLGRSLTTAAGDRRSISWSGSMFEYLMPALVMQSFPFTLLDQTYQGAVAAQIAYGAERGVPWGVSESAYNARDRNQVYQYRAFGVPDLALKRGLSRDLVVAPYATLSRWRRSASRHAQPRGARRRRRARRRSGSAMRSTTRGRDRARRQAVVGAFMAHHIGMGLVALTNAIHAGSGPRRFHATRSCGRRELVLFERIPRRFMTQEAQTGEVDERPRRGWPRVEKPAARLARYRRSRRGRTSRCSGTLPTP